MYLRDMKPPLREPPPPPVDDDIAAGNERLEALLQDVSSITYTSADMEEDFTTAMQLLTVSVEFLRVLRDLDKKFSTLSPNLSAGLKEHLSAVEEFTNNWE